MIIQGGTDEFDALVYGTPHPASIQYFTTQYQQTVQNAQNFLGDLGQRFINTAAQVYQNYVSPQALARVKNIIHHYDEFDNERIVELIELATLQSAGNIMQRWNMANPIIRDAYHKQRVDGYSDTYQDMEPGVSGIGHYDYRMVTQGVLQYTYDENNQIDGTVYSNYYVEDELRDDDVALGLCDKVDILSTWDLLTAFYNKGEEDPTSAVGGYL